MDLNIIRAGIFFVGGLVCIIFRERLNNMKNRLFVKFKILSKPKDERKSYIYIAILFFIISLVLLWFGLHS